LVAEAFQQTTPAISRRRSEGSQLSGCWDIPSKVQSARM
jgi:hypothetical protein